MAEVQPNRRDSAKTQRPREMKNTLLYDIIIFYYHFVFVIVIISFTLAVPAGRKNERPVRSSPTSYARMAWPPGDKII